jgi:hypothetical protein
MHRKVWAVLLLLSVSCSITHAQVSYDFAVPLPPSGQEVQSIALPYFGIYSSDQADMDYEFNAQGIFAVSLIFSSISRETIRESSTYRVSNGWLHGMKANDSIPCELQGEYYHFAIKQKEQLIGNEESANVLMKISDRTYILNFAENGTFTPSIFEFKGSELHVRHFTYEDETTFPMIAEQLDHSGTEMRSVTLRPTKEEWDKLPVESITGQRIIFNRN